MNRWDLQLLLEITASPDVRGVFARWRANALLERGHLERAYSAPGAYPRYRLTRHGFEALRASGIGVVTF
jgi:hypothetical protein